MTASVVYTDADCFPKLLGGDWAPLVGRGTVLSSPIHRLGKCPAISHSDTIMCGTSIMLVQYIVSCLLAAQVSISSKIFYNVVEIEAYQIIVDNTFLNIRWEPLGFSYGDNDNFLFQPRKKNRFFLLLRQHLFSTFPQKTAVCSFILR